MTAKKILQLDAYKKLFQYKDHAIDPGPGLRGVLTHNLAECMKMSPDDDVNLRGYFQWARENLPHGSWGSESKCNQWMRQKGGYIWT